MKLTKFKKLILLFSLFLFYIPSFSQRKMVIGRDTVVVLTPEELTKANILLSLGSSYKQENKQLKELLKKDSIEATLFKNSIGLKDEQLKIKDLQYKNLRSFYRKRVRTAWASCILSVVSLLTLGLVLR